MSSQGSKNRCLGTDRGQTRARTSQDRNVQDHGISCWREEKPITEIRNWVGTVSIDHVSASSAILHNTRGAFSTEPDIPLASILAIFKKSYVNINFYGTASRRKGSIPGDLSPILREPHGKIQTGGTALSQDGSQLLWQQQQEEYGGLWGQRWKASWCQMDKAGRR